MNKLHFLFFLFIVTSFLNAQWTNQNPVPDGNNLWSTFFVNDSTGWIIGSDGFIKKTTNAGLDWISQNSGTSLTLKSVQFIDLNNGWICGENGLILKTTNGGIYWHKMITRPSEIFTNIDFCNENVGYISGYKGTILKTTDSGKTWIIQSSEKSFDLFSIDFVDTLLGYAAGGTDSSILLKTTDGGINWSVSKINLGNNAQNKIYKVLFLNKDKGFLAGGAYDNSSFIYKTIDGGKSWEEALIISSSQKPVKPNKQMTGVNESGGINSLYFMDSERGYSVGGFGNGWERKIYTTSDGGSTWLQKHYGVEENGLLSVYGNSSGKAWAVGFTGVMFYTENYGDSWTQLLSGNKSSLWSGDDIHSVFFIDKNTGWAVGKRNSEVPGVGDVIYNTTNGGKIWKTQYYHESSHGLLRDVYFINKNTGWAVGANGLVKTSDGGQNWYSAGLDCGASSLYIANEDTGWISNDYYDAGKSGIYKSTDGGITWVRKNTSIISSLSFIDHNQGWATGPGGLILVTTDAGENWSNQISGTSSNLNSIQFYSNNIGVCTGDDGTILLSTDGGETWNSVSSHTTDNLMSVGFTNASTFWVAGSNGRLLQTINSGNSWIVFEKLTENDLASIIFLDGTTGWLCGLNGTIFKYNNNFVPVELIGFKGEFLNDAVQLEWETATETNNYGFEIQRKINGESWNKVGFLKGRGNSSGTQSYLYTDNNAANARSFIYRLKQIDFDGSYNYSNEIEINYVPKGFVLYQNYPNPFNPTTTISWELPVDGQVTLKVFDTLGNEVATLLNDHRTAGKYQTKFDASDLPSGIYVYRVIAGNISESKKMILLK